MLQRTLLTTPTTLSEKAVHDISGALMLLLSDVFALYLKTKNFHWHMSGPHFRDYHLMLDDQSDQIFANMREVHSLCDEAGDVATASLLENWIDESEKRTWFLFECGRDV